MFTDDREHLNKLVANAIFDIWTRQTGKLCRITLEGTVCISSDGGSTSVLHFSNRFSDTNSEIIDDHSVSNPPLSDRSSTDEDSYHPRGLHRERPSATFIPPNMEPLVTLRHDSRSDLWIVPQQRHVANDPMPHVPKVNFNLKDKMFHEDYFKHSGFFPLPKFPINSMLTGDPSKMYDDMSDIKEDFKTAEEHFVDRIPKPNLHTSRIPKPNLSSVITRELAKDFSPMDLSNTQNDKEVVQLGNIRGRMQPQQRNSGHPSQTYHNVPSPKHSVTSPQVSSGAFRPLNETHRTIHRQDQGEEMDVPIKDSEVLDMSTKGALSARPRSPQEEALSDKTMPTSHHLVSPLYCNTFPSPWNMSPKAGTTPIQSLNAMNQGLANSPLEKPGNQQATFNMNQQLGTKQQQAYPPNASEEISRNKEMVYPAHPLMSQNQQQVHPQHDNPLNMRDQQLGYPPSPNSVPSMDQQIGYPPSNNLVTSQNPSQVYPSGRNAMLFMDQQQHYPPKTNRGVCRNWETLGPSYPRPPGNENSEPASDAMHPGHDRSGHTGQTKYHSPLRLRELESEQQSLLRPHSMQLEHHSPRRPTMPPDQLSSAGLQPTAADQLPRRPQSMSTDDQPHLGSQTVHHSISSAPSNIPKAIDLQSSSGLQHRPPEKQFHPNRAEQERRRADSQGELLPPPALIPIESNEDSHQRPSVNPKRNEQSANRKVYYCNFCPKKFYFRSKYMEHMPSHSKLKLFKCSMCSHTYKNKYYLQVHYRSHLGIPTKSRVCPYCEAEFPSNKLLGVHIQKKHPNSGVSLTWKSVKMKKNDMEKQPV